MKLSLLTKPQTPSPKNCRHTAADAYQNNYEVIFANEATNSFTKEDYEYGLRYAKETYGANNYNNKELADLFAGK